MNVKWMLGFVAMAALLIFGRRLFARNSTGQVPRVAPVNGIINLRPPRWYHAFLAALALLPGVVVGILLISAEMVGRNGPGGRVISALAILGSLAWSAFLIAEEVKLHIRVDGAALERVGVFGVRRMPWSDVETIGYNANGRWFFLTGAGLRIWVGEDMDGISDFSELALAHLPTGVLQAAPGVREELEGWVKAAPRAIAG
jgi:hypothetical protein